MAKLTNSKNEAVAKALKRGSTTNPAATQQVLVAVLLHLVDNNVLLQKAQPVLLS